MVTNITYIDYEGQKYPAYCSLNVLEWMQNKYGTLDKFIEKIGGGESGEPSIGILIETYTEIINEGIDCQNDIKSSHDELITCKKAGRIISALGIEGAYKTLMEIMGTEEVPAIDSEDEDNVTQTKNSKSRAKK